MVSLDFPKPQSNGNRSDFDNRAQFNVDMSSSFIHSFIQQSFTTKKETMLQFTIWVRAMPEGHEAQRAREFARADSRSASLGSRKIGKDFFIPPNIGTLSNHHHLRFDELKKEIGLSWHSGHLWKRGNIGVLPDL